MAQIAHSRARAAHGIIAASLTPMHESGKANIALLAQHCEALLADGCSSVLVLGTTGEANSFSLQERREILEGIISSNVAPSRLIVGTGCCAVADTVALSQHALSLGVHRALMLPPFFYKPVTEEGLYVAFASTIEQIGDDRLRLFLYLIPQLTGIDISVKLISRLQRDYSQTIAGLKDSSGNWDSTRQLCEALATTIDVMAGTEALLLRALALGAAGGITASANVNAAQLSRLYQTRDEPSAKALDRTVQSQRHIFERFPLIAALKSRLVEVTGDASWRHVRPPLQPLDDASAKQLSELLKNTEHEDVRRA